MPTILPSRFRRPMFGVAIAAIAVAVTPSLASAGTELGVYFPGPAQYTVAKALGVHTLRVHVQTTGARSALTLAGARAAREAGYRLVISYFNSCNGTACAISDDAAWKAQFAASLAAVKPAMAVIENEENNPSQAYSMDQYKRQLIDAIPVAHAAGVPITNGGLTSMGVTLAYWHHLWTSGDKAGADAFAKVAFAPGVTPAGDLGAYLPSSARPSPASWALIDAPGRTLPDTEALIAFYATTGQDAINIHLYNLPADLVRQVVAWVHKTTGLPVTCNEMGTSSTQGSPVTDEVQGGIAAGLSDIIWFGPDGTGSGHAIGAANPDGSLRDGGIAYAAVARANP